MFVTCQPNWFLLLFFFQEWRAKGGPLKETAHNFLQCSEFFCRNGSLFVVAVVDKSIRSWDGMMSHWKNTDVDFIGDMTDTLIVQPHTGNRGGCHHECVTTCPPLFWRVQLLVPTLYADGREPCYQVKQSIPCTVTWRGLTFLHCGII